VKPGKGPGLKRDVLNPEKIGFYITFFKHIAPIMNIIVWIFRTMD